MAQYYCVLSPLHKLMCSVLLTLFSVCLSGMKGDVYGDVQDLLRLKVFYCSGSYCCCFSPT